MAHKVGQLVLVDQFNHKSPGMVVGVDGEFQTVLVFDHQGVRVRTGMVTDELPPLPGADEALESVRDPVDVVGLETRLENLAQVVTDHAEILSRLKQEFDMLTAPPKSPAQPAQLSQPAQPSIPAPSIPDDEVPAVTPATAPIPQPIYGKVGGKKEK